VTRAFTPVGSVVSIRGANKGEWLPGASADDPPIPQNTEGTPAAVPNSPKSSLPMIWSISTAVSNAPASRAVRPASLTVTGNELSVRYDGGRGAPEATASASMIRRAPSVRRRCTSASKARKFSVIVAVSGMTFSACPARSRDTVTTPRSAGAISRATSVCSRSTAEAAITTGSTVRSGREPCPPRPYSVTSQLSAAPIIAPARYSTVPASLAKTCWPSTASGTPTRRSRPSSSIAFAPAPISSAGWKTAITVPCQSPRAAASSAAAPHSQVTCMSWPQACITCVRSPRASVATTSLA
jgi:hypothetical protein